MEFVYFFVVFIIVDEGVNLVNELVFFYDKVFSLYVELLLDFENS